ncbi:MAG: glycosyltransferase family 39 protein [Gaiellaceae bacterium]
MRGGVPAWAVLAVLVGVSALVRFWAGERIAGLWIMPDEAIYASIGQSLYRSGELSIFGGGTALYSVVYPLLIGLPLAVGDLERGYLVLKALQALVMSLTAVPVYLWGRTLMRPGWALAAAALTLALPGLLYSGLIMTEVAFLPVSVLAAWAMARALEDPTGGRQAMLVLAIAVAGATRLQAIVLVPALLTAIALKSLFDRDARTVRRFLPTFVALAVLALAWSAYRLTSGGGWSQLLGSYQVAGQTRYDPVEVARFALYHLGDTLLLVGIVPLCALALLALEAGAGRERVAAVRSYLAVAVSLVVWFVIEVGAFASVHVQRLAERDLLALAPVLFLALGLWLDRGAPRPLVATAVAAIAAFATLAVLPIQRFSQAEALPDAFTIAPLFKLIERDPTYDPELLVLIVAAVLLAGFALLPRRLLVAVPVAVFVVLAIASVTASREVAERATYDDEFLLGGDRSWVDEVKGVDGPVAFLYTGEVYWNGVYQHLVWNDRIDQVYYLFPIAVPGPLPQEPVRTLPDGLLARRGGRFAPERYVVASAATKFIGTPLAELQQYGILQPGLILWRLQGDLRLSYTVSGVRPDGDMHEPGRIVAHRCDEGFFRITLIAKASRRVRLVRNGRPYRTLRFASESETWSEDIPAVVESGFRSCTLEVRADSLLGSTVFEFVRRS